jgi:hypothetical protein
MKEQETDFYEGYYLDAQTRNPQLGRLEIARQKLASGQLTRQSEAAKKTSQKAQTTQKQERETIFKTTLMEL